MNNIKSNIRKEIKNFFSSESGKQIIEKAKKLQTSEDYCKEFLNKINTYQNAKTIFAYYPLRPEFPTLGLLQQAEKDDKEIAIPLISGKELIFKKVTFINKKLFPVAKGSFDVFEPTEEAETIYPNGNLKFPLIVLVPGRAFSKKGARLGWGGGFYDRFFEKLFLTYKEKINTNKKNITLVGLSFSKQLREDIPIEKFDYNLDMILTEN